MTTKLSETDYRVLPKEEGVNVTYWYEGDELKKDKLIKKSHLDYNADAIRTWGMMRTHLREIRATYAGLNAVEKNKNKRLKLYHYEAKIQEYILKLEKIITIQFIEVPRVEFNNEYRDGNGY